MRDALPPSRDGLARTGVVCECCGAVVVTGVEGLFANPRVGSARRFCSASCRQAAYRRRRGGAAEDAPRQRSGGRGRRLGARGRGEPEAGGGRK